MTTQERDYMGREEEPQVNAELTHSVELDDLRKKLAASEELRTKAEREIKAVNEMFKKERSLRESAEIEASANLKALQKSKKVLQAQGEALICEHYGLSRYKLLMVARALIGTATAPDEKWRLNAVNWFDDFEREIRGLACEPMPCGKIAKELATNPESKPA